MTRIPELEQELVAAAGRLQSPRRRAWPAARAALAAGAVAVVVVLAVVLAADNDHDGARRPRPPGALPLPPNPDLVDHEAGVRFTLDGRVLTVRLLASATSKTRNRVNGHWIRATCGEGLTGGQGDPSQRRTRLWPAGSTRVRFRFGHDISRIARWCRLEDPVVGHVAFVKFSTASPEARLRQTIERTGNRWARLFAASAPAACDRYMTQPACERIACERPGGRTVRNCTPLSAEFLTSFRDATVRDIVIRGDLAGAKFSNGEAVELLHMGGSVWWISKLGPNAGRDFFK